MTATWSGAMRTYIAADAGIVRIFIPDPSQTGEFLLAANRGDEIARDLLQITNRSAGRIDEQTPDQPVKCLLCDQHVPDPERTLCCIALPAIAPPGHAAHSIICCTCALHDDLLDRAIAALRTSLWPDLRPVPVSALVGHA